MKVLLASPRGFCAGVERAIEIVERALEKHGAPVYVRHEIVHNRRVVDMLRARGAIFVKEVDEIPPGAVTVFSAHGVARRVETAAGERRLEVIDATCPLVAKVHREGSRYAALGYDVVLVGHRGHPEVEGTLGRIDGRVHVVATVADVGALAVERPDRVAYITQTTLSVADTREIIEALTARFPAAVGPDTRDICYATHNRQQAVLDLAPRIDVLVVVGAAYSSNSTRLREIGEKAGVASHLVASVDELDRAWFDGATAIGVTAGASAPEVIVQEVLARFADWWPIEVETMPGIVEDLRFKLPPSLMGGDRAGGDLAAARSDVEEAFTPQGV